MSTSLVSTGSVITSSNTSDGRRSDCIRINSRLSDTAIFSGLDSPEMVTETVTDGICDGGI